METTAAAVVAFRDLIAWAEHLATAHPEPEVRSAVSKGLGAGFVIGDAKKALEALEKTLSGRA